MKFNFLMLSFFIWTSSAFPILRKSLSPNRNLYRPRFYCNSEYDEKDIVGSRTDTNVDDLSLEDLLTKLDQYDNEDDVPAELKRALEIQIQEKGKLTFQETLTMLGFNNFSFFIIGLSLFFIALNSFLGYGWASRLLGWDDSYLVKHNPMIIRDENAADMSSVMPKIIDLNSRSNLLR